MTAIIGRYSGIGFERHQSERGIEVDIEPNNLQKNADHIDSRTNRRENSGSTVETARMDNCDVTNQVTRKLDVIKRDLTFQILEAKNSAISDKVLPSIQSNLGTQGTGENSKVDFRLYRSSEVEDRRKAQEKCPKINLNCSIRGCYKRETYSTDSEIDIDHSRIVDNSKRSTSSRVSAKKIFRIFSTKGSAYFKNVS